MTYSEEKLPLRKILFQHADGELILIIAAATVFFSWLIALVVAMIMPMSYAGLVIFLAAPALFILTVFVFLIVLSINERAEKEET